MKLPSIARRGFKPGSKGAAHVLGELQTQVMEILWRQPGLTVNEVEERLKSHRSIAHTTVLTTLDRMHQNGYLTREKQGKAFVYAPRYTKQQFEQGMVQEVIGALLGQFTEPTMSAFVDLLGEDEERLKRLETLINEKRRSGRRKPRLKHE